MSNKVLNRSLTICFIVYFIFIIYSILFKYVTINELFDLSRLAQRTITFREYGSILWGDMFQSIVFFIPIGMFLCIYNNDDKVVSKLIVIILFGAFIELFKYLLVLGPVDVGNAICLICGGILGMVIYYLLEKIFNDKKRVKAFMLLLMVVILLFIITLIIV